MTTHPRTFTAAEIRALEGPLLDAGIPLMARAAGALAEHVSRQLRSGSAPADERTGHGHGHAGGEHTVAGQAHASGEHTGATSPTATPAADRPAAHDLDAASRNSGRAAGPPRIMLLVGGGDNGGDALFAGATLARGGSIVEIAPTSDRMHPAGLAEALAAGAHIVTIADDEPAEVAARAASADVIVDGILGLGRGGTAAGGSPALRGRAREIVAATVRELRAAGIRPFVVAVDLPSGVDPDSGDVTDPDAVLTADLTVTFIGVKTGLVRAPAADFAGEVVLETLGVEGG